MADNFTDWLYRTIKQSDLGKRADANWDRRQLGAPPAIPIPGVDWTALDASRSPLGAALHGSSTAQFGVAGQDPFMAPFPTEGYDYFAPTGSRFNTYRMHEMATPQVPSARGGGLTTRKVATVPIDTQTGNPAPRTGSSFAGGWGSAGHALPGMNASPTQFADRNAGDTVQNIPAPLVAQKPPTIDTTSPFDMYKQFGIMPSPPKPSAVEAIDQLTGSGRSTAMPFPLPMFRQPMAPPSGRGQEWVDQGPDMGALNSVGTGAPPMPRNRPNLPLPPAPPPPASYTIQKGDTLSALAKKFGTTIGQLANANNISNPNKIRAGASLNLSFMAPPVPRTPNAAQRWTHRYSGMPATPPSIRPPQTRAERFSNLDAFGNII